MWRKNTGRSLGFIFQTKAGRADGDQEKQAPAKCRFCPMPVQNKGAQLDSIQRGEGNFRCSDLCFGNPF
jgi:hypothetical protein